MPQMEASIVIERPVKDVFDFVENPEHESIWRAGREMTGQTSAGPVGVGTTGHEIAVFLGRRVESTWEITEFELNRKVSYRSTSGPIEYQGIWTYEPHDAGTKLTIQIDAKAGFGGLFGRLADPLVIRIAGRRAQEDLKRPRNLLEA